MIIFNFNIIFLNILTSGLSISQSGLVNLLNINQSTELPICSFYRLFGNQREHLLSFVTGYTPYQSLTKCIYLREYSGFKTDYPIVQERNNTSINVPQMPSSYTKDAMYCLLIMVMTEIARTLIIFILSPNPFSTQSMYSFSLEFSILDITKGANLFSKGQNEFW